MIHLHVHDVGMACSLTLVSLVDLHDLLTETAHEEECWESTVFG